MSEDDDRNLRYCDNEQQRENYTRLRDFGFRVTHVMGGYAHIYFEGRTVEVPLQFNASLSLPGVILTYAFEKGHREGVRDLQQAYKELMERPLPKHES